MEDKANISRKFIMAAVLLLIPVFAAMIIIFVLLSNGVIDVLVAFILMIVVFGVILFGIISLIRTDRKSTRLNSSHRSQSRMPSSA